MAHKKCYHYILLLHMHRLFLCVQEHMSHQRQHKVACNLNIPTNSIQNCICSSLPSLFGSLNLSWHKVITKDYMWLFVCMHEKQYLFDELTMAKCIQCIKCWCYQMGLQLTDLILVEKLHIDQREMHKHMCSFTFRSQVLLHSCSMRHIYTRGKNFL